MEFIAVPKFFFTNFFKTLRKNNSFKRSIVKNMSVKRNQLVSENYLL